MAIKFDKLFALMRSKGMPASALRYDKVVGNASFEALKGHYAKDKNGAVRMGGVSARTINSICAYLQCQPGDIMEYVPDDAPAETKTDFGPFISHLQSKGMLQAHELETSEEAMRRSIMARL